mgnify:CR=1 FL=1
MPSRGRLQFVRYLALLTELGLSVVVPTLLGALAGRWLDDRLGSAPLLLVLGLLLGLAGGARNAYGLVKRLMDKEDQ